MVHYMTPRNAQKPRAETLSAPDVATELAAMQRIAMALSDVPDIRIRLRVMRWAMERFLATAVPQTTAPAAPAQAAAVASFDTTLDVADLHEFFVNDTVDSDDDDCTEPAAEDTQPAAEESIESMLKSFVTDFQRIAAVCQLA
jgi:hypothetical protein